MYLTKKICNCQNCTHILIAMLFENYYSVLVILLPLVNLSFYILIYVGHLAIHFVHNHWYFLTILDDHTRFVWMILLKNKSEVSQHVQNFITMVIIQFHTTQDCKGKQWSLILARTIICIKGHYSSKILCWNSTTK